MLSLNAMAGVLRDPSATGANKMASAGAPCFVAGQRLQTKVLWRRCSELMTVALGPVSIMAWGSSTLLKESRES